MKLKTIRVRRARPSAPALALALALTMLCVYLLSLSSLPEDARSGAASALSPSEAELRMEGLTVAFDCEAHCADLTEARIAAANCASTGGAGLVLSDEGKFAVVREAASPDTAPEGALLRSESGLTLRLHGPASEIAAVSDAVDFLRAQACETGDFAGSLELGDDGAGAVVPLLEVYRTQGERALAALQAVDGSDAIVARLRDAVQADLNRLNETLQVPGSGALRLLHAAACCQWLDLLRELASKA